MKKFMIIVLVLVLTLSCSCVKTPNPTSSPTAAQTTQTVITASPSPVPITVENYPRVDGSTATIPLSIALMQKLTGCDESVAEIKIVHTRTHQAYKRLVDNEVDLLIVYAPPKEAEDYIALKGAKLTFKPIGKDALIFIANKDNPVTNLTTEQIKKIYTGQLTNWKSLGGQDKEIAAFQRPDESGSQTLMKKLVMKDTAMMAAPTIRKPESMGELIEKLAEYDNEANSIGFSVFYYASEMYTQPNLKFLSVDGVAPTKDTIRSGDYPHINEFYAVIREGTDRNSPAYRAFQWLTTAEGKKLIEDNNYVSVK